MQGMEGGQWGIMWRRKGKDRRGEERERIARRLFNKHVRRTGVKRELNGVLPFPCISPTATAQQLKRRKKEKEKRKKKRKKKKRKLHIPLVSVSPADW